MMKERMPRRESLRPGFTLIELIVVLAIMALLISLLVPAVMKVRSVAYLIKSKNQLRQIALATHNFASAQGDLLPNVSGQKPNTPGCSVLQTLLPFLDNPPMLLDGDAGYYRIFQSPLDPSLGLPKGPDAGGDTSYAVNPILFRIGAKLPGSVPDGLSNTIAYSEHYARCHTTYFSWSLMSATCLDGKGNQVPCSFGSHRATFADDMFTDVLPVTIGDPPVTTGNVPGLSFQVAPLTQDCDPRIPQSPHPSGLLISLADGSIRTIAPSIRPETFWSLVTPAGGEEVGDW